MAVNKSPKFQITSSKELLEPKSLLPFYVADEGYLDLDYSEKGKWEDQVSKVVVNLPDPTNVSGKQEDDLTRELYRYKWNMLVQCLPYLRDSTAEFNSLINSDLALLRSFFEKISGSGRDIQVIISACNSKYQKFQRRESEFSGLGLTTEELDSLLEVRAERDKAIQERYDFVHSEAYLTMSERDKLADTEKFEANLAAISGKLWAIVHMGMSFLTSKSRYTYSGLKGKEKRDFTKRALRDLKVSEIKKFRSDPSSYKLPKSKS